VASRSHEHPVNSEAVAVARDGVLSVTDAGRLAGLLGMLADPVRSRILFALVTAEELCVGDLALALDVTEDQVSYGLKMLRLAGLVSFRRDGRVVFYRLSDGFPHPLLEHCLRQLLTIAAPPQTGMDPHANADPQTGPAQDTGPTHGVGPAQDVGPVQQASPAQDTGPTHGVGPAQDVGPVQQASPAQDIGPAQQAGPAREAGRARS
jgi:ArsR family transcriptional regulator, lead/cadmium/zinc/bismuth-responsive transcriptional repressor